MGEVGHTLGGEAIEVIDKDDFVTRFRFEFTPVIEVQQLAREVQDLRPTTESLEEIINIFREKALLVP